MRGAFMRCIAPLITLGVCFALLLGCSGESEKAGDSVSVLAAASMQDVLADIGADFSDAHGHTLKPAYAATSTLATQVLDGRDAQVFISANKAWMEKLKEEGALVGDYVVIARNAIVCITSKQSELTAKSARELPQDRFKTIAIANDGVPAGDYARQFLTRIGLLKRLEPKLVGQANVRDVLRAVAQGDADVGFVYASDAQALSDQVKVLFPANPATHDPVEYYAALLHLGKDRAAAQGLMAFLTSEQAQKRFAEHGFQPVKAAKGAK